MDGARYLLPEDRPDYERVLDEALRRVRHNTQLTSKNHFNAEQLRAITLDAIPLVAPRAATEYERYLELRTRLRRPERPLSDGPVRDRPRPNAAAGSLVEEERTGAGILVVISVLVPVLAGIAAMIFLLAGYGLRLADPEPAVASAMRSAGWTFAVVAAAGLLVAAAELVVTALRNDRTSIRAGRPASGPRGLAEEVDEAREHWHRALLEQGIIPFLRDALEDPLDRSDDSTGTEGTDGTDGTGTSGKPESGSRTPRLRFSSPRFSSPGERPHESGTPAEETSRFINPSFSSPKFSSRDGDGDGVGGASRFSSPRFTSPAEHRDDSPASSPGFASPSYRTPENDGESRPRYGTGGFASPAYQTPGERAGEDAGPRFGSRGYASPAYQTPESDEDSGRYGSRGFASPKLAGSDREEREGEEGAEPDSRFGKPGFASPKLAGSADEERPADTQ